jgi:hypothetical protein
MTLNLFTLGGPRSFKESPVRMGADEVRTFSFDCSTWGAYSSGEANVIKDSKGVDQSATLLSGSPSVATNTITTSKVTGLTAGETYRLEIKWVSSSGETFEALLIIKAET